MNLLDSPES